MSKQKQASKPKQALDCDGLDCDGLDCEGSISILRLGDQHNPLEESLEVEFKEFCLNEIKNGLEDINYCIKTGKIRDKIKFNQDVYNNIKYYFYKYIPKYISAFINANINGELIIGVNDYGEITGIPFIGSKQELEDYINEQNLHANILNLIKDSSQSKVDFNCIKYEYENLFEIKYEIQELKIDINYIDNMCDKLLLEYYNNVKLKETLIKKYKQERLKWIKKMDEFTCKLPILLSTKKYEFKEYLKINAPQYVDFIIKDHEMRHISHLKINPSHYIYWLMKFKDVNLEKIKRQKPEMPEMPKIINDPKNIYKKLTHLRYKLIKSNNNLNYFIINIKINKKNENINSNSIMYYNLHKNKWIKNIRKLNYDGPKCDTRFV